MRRATEPWVHTKLGEAAIACLEKLMVEAAKVKESAWREDRQEDNPQTGPVRSQLLIKSSRMSVKVRRLADEACAAVDECLQSCPCCRKPMSQHVVKDPFLCKYPKGSECFAHTDAETGVAVSVMLPSVHRGGELMVGRVRGRMEDTVVPPSASGPSSSSMSAEDAVLAQFCKERDITHVPLNSWDAVAFDGTMHVHAVQPVTSGVRYVLIMNHEDCESKSVSI